MLKFPVMEDAGYIVRSMREDDIPQVAEVDRDAFPDEWMFRSPSSYKRELGNPLAHYLIAWTPREMLNELDKPRALQLPFFTGLFRRRPLSNKEEYTLEYIVGFASFWLMANDAHITSIAVRSKYRRIGIGEALLISIIELAERLDAAVVTLEVRASNEVAKSLYQKYGFHVVGKRLRYYSNNSEDALIMDTDRIISASFQSHFQNLRREHTERYEDIYLQVF